MHLNSSPFITVFTAIHNRAYCIIDLYESLCRQSCVDFEWMVIDDGSTDNISDIMQSFIDEGKITIHYSSQKWQGKHVAINNGVCKARGEFFFIVDSDDYLTDDAIEYISRQCHNIKDREEIAGVSGLDIDVQGNYVSKFTSSECIECIPLEIRTNYKVRGDLSEVFRTEVLRNLLFPTIEGERFCSEAVLIARLSKKLYKLIYYPKVIKVVRYLPDGLSASIDEIRIRNPRLSMLLYQELLALEAPLVEKIKWSVNLWRFFFHTDLNKRESFYLNKKWRMCAPIGFMLYIKDVLYTLRTHMTKSSSRSLKSKVNK